MSDLRIVTADELAAAIALHEKWCAGEACGVRLDMSNCDLGYGASLDRAILDGASLDGASLDGASLDGARLIGASLDRASLVGARLVGASLDGASLVGASLDRASLDRASLDGASLDRASLDRASLDGASLDGASLVGASLDRARLFRASLDGASLDGADLSRIRADLFAVLDAAPVEVHGLLTALRAGQVDGSVYRGKCACLIGTIANVRGCDYEDLADLKPNASRPAERWFLAIAEGDTPETNKVAKITEGWIVEWIAKQPQPAAGVTP